MSFHKFSNNEYRPMLVDTQFDFCAIQNGIGSSPLYTVLMKMIENSTNFNRKCPLPPGEYYIKNFNLQAQHLPNIIPSGLYKVNFTMHTYNNT